jgi:hypothetical protein
MREIQLKPTERRVLEPLLARRSAHAGHARRARIGIDEHLFKHDFRLAQPRSVTMIVDHKNKRLMVEGKTAPELRAALEYIPGRENVLGVARHVGLVPQLRAELFPERAAAR